VLDHAGPNREDQVRLLANYFAGQLGIMFSPSRPGVSLDDDILSLDIAEPAQFLKKRDKTRGSCFTQVSHRGRRVNDRNVIDLLRLLRLRAHCRGRNQQTGYELPPPHLLTVDCRGVGEITSIQTAWNFRARPFMQ